MAPRRGDHRGRTCAVLAHALGRDGNNDPGKPESGQGGEIAVRDARVASPIGAAKRRHRCRSFPTLIASRGGDPGQPREVWCRLIVARVDSIVYDPRQLASGAAHPSVPKMTKRLIRVEHAQPMPVSGTEAGSRK